MSRAWTPACVGSLLAALAALASAAGSVAEPLAAADRDAVAGVLRRPPASWPVAVGPARRALPDATPGSALADHLRARVEVERRSDGMPVRRVTIGITVPF